MAQRRFSHAIAEGDGISVVAAVEDADAARAAEEQRAEALVVRGDPTAVRDASSLPILWRADVSLERASTAADAYLLVFDALEEDDGKLEDLHSQALELGLDCAVEVRDEEELERALERVDPEIFLLSPAEREED
jgi:indole-3-glycerol phosphate synthase